MFTLPLGTLNILALTGQQAEYLPVSYRASPLKGDQFFNYATATGYALTLVDYDLEALEAYMLCAHPVYCGQLVVYWQNLLYQTVHGESYLPKFKDELGAAGKLKHLIDRDLGRLEAIPAFLLSEQKDSSLGDARLRADGVNLAWVLRDEVFALQLLGGKLAELVRRIPANDPFFQAGNFRGSDLRLFIHKHCSSNLLLMAMQDHA